MVIAKGELSVSSGSSLGRCWEPLGWEAAPWPLPGSPRPGQHRCADSGLPALPWLGLEPRADTGLLTWPALAPSLLHLALPMLTSNRFLGLQPLASLFLLPRGAQMC